MIGTGFMGKSHAMAYQAVPFIFPSAARPVGELVADVSEEAAAAAAEATGFRRATGDWRALVRDPAVDVVDITTPNVLHKEMALATIAAGKHVYCEKPLALTASDALEMTQAAEAAGVKTLVGFNFLKNPAAGMIKGIIDEGGIGDIVHFRGTFDQDALADPSAPFSWRFESSASPNISSAISMKCRARSTPGSPNARWRKAPSVMARWPRRTPRCARSRTTTRPSSSCALPRAPAAPSRPAASPPDASCG
jgi:predicted dehydrogenase